jgi:uncharacterized iron-regulated protein
MNRNADTLPEMPLRFRRRAYLMVALWLCLVSCAWRSRIERIETATSPDQELWQTIEKADVVYVGETHDDSAHHQYELELIRGLLNRKMKFAIGWEMFDETQQETMDLWASHMISLPVMLAKTDFQRHWGVYSPVYQQILQVAERANVPCLPLNAPPELVQKIARGESLTAEQKAMIPTGFIVTRKGYRNFLAMMGDHPGMNKSDERRFFDAQNVWDETMASRILEFKSRHPTTRLVVFTGRGHVSDGQGIPFYVSQKAALKQIILLPAAET